MKICVDTKILLDILKDEIRSHQEKLYREHKIRIEPLDVDSVINAGRRWIKYLERKLKVKCPQCGHTLDAKEHFPELGGYENCLKESQS